ncbi:MAG: amidohydrolase [Deltaproteobacteria bacterium]|nr:amidohydrolase [Deltaproteobacteria bacterium]
MIILLLLFGLFPLTSFSTNDGEYVEQLTQRLVPFYEKLHQNPELSFQEEKTSTAFAAQLRELGFQVQHPFGGFGVVGTLKNGEGPTVLLRTDLDALPILEQTQLPYASKIRNKTAQGLESGVMHACGHDLHITNMVGVANYLKQHKNRWKGTAMIIGQPAEEKGAGAKAMLKAGLFKKFPHPNFALAMHVESSQTTGKVRLISGPVTANVDSIDIKMKGRGGHGATPHETIDPIPMTSELVLSLQSLVSREKDPFEPAVITVGSFHAGSKHNIIADYALLQLTIRTFSPSERTRVIEGITRRAKAIASAYGAPEPEINSSEDPVPSVINDPEMVATLKPVITRIIGAKNILDGHPSTVGEDFSRYGLEGVPSVMVSVGVLTEKRLEQYRKKGHVPSLHSSTFYPSVLETLRISIPVLGESAIELFNPQDGRLAPLKSPIKG